VYRESPTGEVLFLRRRHCTKMATPLFRSPVPGQGTHDLPGLKRRVCLITSIALFALFMVEAQCDAEQESLPWHITADRIVSLVEKDLYLAEGAVVISKGDQILEADKVTYNRHTGHVEAEGNVSLSSAGDFLRCDRGTFNLKERTGHLSRGSLFLMSNHYYIRGQDVWKTGPATYLIKGCRITSCDGDNPDWSITGSEVEVTMEGYGTVKHAAFYVRHIPLLYFPYIVFPAKTQRQTGFLLPSAGYSKRNGVDLEVPFFWAISEQTDATFYERYLGERGSMHGLEFRYLTGPDSKGIFLYDTISDRRREKDMYSEDDLEISPYPRTNRERYWFRGRADQDLPFGIVSRLDVDFVSDYDYLREFKEPSLGTGYRVRLDQEWGRPLEEIQSPLRRSAVRMSRDFQDLSFQAMSSYFQRPERPQGDTTSQPIADIDLSILPQGILNLPIYFTLDSDYGYVYRETGLKGQRFSLSPSIRYPLWPIPYVELEPSITYLIAAQWPEDHEEGGQSQTRDVYELGLRISTIAERIFDLNRGNLKRIKHKIQPTLSYTFRPYREEEVLSPWFETVDTMGRLNAISLSLDNYLDARRQDEKGTRTYFRSAHVNLTQAYDLDEVREEMTPGAKRKPFGPLQGALRLTPYPDLDLRADANWDHYEEHISSGSVGLDLGVGRSGGRKDSYSIDYVYVRDSAKSLNYEATMHLAHGFSIGAGARRDLVIKHDIEDTYWIDYQSQCWGLRLLYEDLDEDRRVMLTFRLAGIGSAGPLQ
jgi:LPS-assembly protein